MRILLIGPLISNAGHGAECGIYDAFNKLGHETEAWDYREQKFINLEGERFSCEGKVESGVEYDIVLAPGPGVPDSVLNSVYFKSLVGPKVLWNSEPLRLPSYYRKMEAQKDVFDFVFTFSSIRTLCGLSRPNSTISSRFSPL